MSGEVTFAYTALKITGFKNSRLFVLLDRLNYQINATNTNNFQRHIMAEKNHYFF